MEIKIKVTKKEANHLKSPHTFYDSCEQADNVLEKVQREIDKQLKKAKKNGK